GPRRRRRHAQARDPRPAGQGRPRRPAAARVRRDHRRAPGQAVRARGRRGADRGAARPGPQPRRDAAVQPGHRGLHRADRRGHRM
ncbi:MAG: Phosphoribosylformylglycinamidine synthase, PurS subunit, partial [uncultured Nocardioidaceae bacterium]